MRVLLSGAINPRFEALPDYIAAALRRLGHEVALFDHRSRILPGRVRERVRSLDRLERIALNRRLAGVARRFKPGLLLVNQGAEIAPETISSIRLEIGAFTVNWWSDYPAQFEEGLELARCGVYDRFYVSGTDAESRHHAAGARETRWLPFGCDPAIHRPAALEPAEKGLYGARLAFVGSAYPERRDLLAPLADLGLAIWGPGWERFREDAEIGRCIRGGALRPAEWVRVFSAADLVVNVSYGFGGAPDRYGSMANVRVFEALACGACQIVDAKHDISAMFRDGEHLVLYRSAGELRRRAESLLGDPERRARISRQGRREAIERHTWAHRLERILCELSASAFLKPAEARA